jgi:preprotein translocase subunit SecD
MNFYVRRFNLYLLLMLAVAAAPGCASWHKKDKDKDIGAIRIHMESPPSDQSQSIQLLRSSPVVVVVGDEPVLTEDNIIAATLLETPGGFAIRIKFDETGAWMLEQNTAAYAGKHMVIFGQWGSHVSEGRWLAAPLIVHRIADGTLTFTPDASREEAAKLVKGLNVAAKKNIDKTNK